MDEAAHDGETGGIGGQVERVDDSKHIFGDMELCLDFWFGEGPACPEAVEGGIDHESAEVDEEMHGS